MIHIRNKGEVMAKVLLGSPNGEVLDLVTAILESLEHEVQSVSSSFDFLTHAEEDSPQILILDDDLGPQSMEEILSLLLSGEENDPTPVVLLTEAQEHPDSGMITMGVIASVNKHIDSKEWMEELTRLLGEEVVSD